MSSATAAVRVGESRPWIADGAIYGHRDAGSAGARSGSVGCGGVRDQELDGARRTPVSCALGYSRSAASVAAWLIATGRSRSVSDAVEMIRARRNGIVLGPKYVAALERWAAAKVGR
ncbi:MAG TPA: dual specificity protein phosphatase family protein [Candidatus Solibacter sp.]|nr:dual specificity protein phosphatase family protein [Candidatus Solibacter sp.]